MATTNELLNYKPYSIGRYTKEGYADICFQSEGIMTVPKKSAPAIVELLNDAFKNGVKMTMNQTKGGIQPPPQPQPVIKSKPMPVEEPHPVSAMTRNRRK